MENVISDIHVIEEDLENVEKKCEKVNCQAIYDVIVATMKLIYDLMFFCCKRGDQK
jgi:hypothetical protein